MAKTKQNKNEKKEKRSLLSRLATWFVGLKKEFKRIHFPSRKEMIKYSFATVIFIVFFALFFYAIDVLFALLQSLGR